MKPQDKLSILALVNKLVDANVNLQSLYTDLNHIRITEAKKKARAEVKETEEKLNALLDSL